MQRRVPPLRKLVLFVALGLAAAAVGYGLSLAYGFGGGPAGDAGLDIARRAADRLAEDFEAAFGSPAPPVSVLPPRSAAAPGSDVPGRRLEDPVGGSEHRPPPFRWRQPFRWKKR